MKNAATKYISFKGLILKIPPKYPSIALESYFEDVKLLKTLRNQDKDSRTFMTVVMDTQDKMKEGQIQYEYYTKWRANYGISIFFLESEIQTYKWSIMHFLLPSATGC